jgi:hypothetical protein
MGLFPEHFVSLASEKTTLADNHLHSNMRKL